MCTNCKNNHLRGSQFQIKIKQQSWCNFVTKFLKGGVVEILRGLHVQNRVLFLPEKNVHQVFTKIVVELKYEDVLSQMLFCKGVVKIETYVVCVLN